MQYLLQASRYVFPLITIPYLTRVLGPDTFAVRAYMISVMALCMVVLDYGFTPYGTKQIASAGDEQVKKDMENKMCGGITLMRITLCICLIPIIMAMSQFTPLMQNNAGYVWIIFASTCLTSLLPDFLFQGKEEMSIITYRYIVTQVLSIVCIFVFIHSPQDLLGVAIIEIICAAIALVWSWQNVIVKQKIRLKLMSTEEMLDAVKISTSFFISTASTTIIASLTTVIMGIAISDASSVSYWSLSMTAVVAVQSLFTPVAQSLYPHMCARKDFSLVQRLLKIGIPIGIIGSIAFALLSKELMWVLGGDDYINGSIAFVLLSPMFTFSFVSQILGYPVLAAVGRIKQLTQSSVIAAGFNVAILVILIAGGWFSLESACIIRVATEVVLCLARCIFAKQWATEYRKLPT